MKWLKPLAYSAVYLGWGTTYLAIRVGVRELAPAAFLGLRFVFASFVLAVVLAGAVAARPGGLRGGFPNIWKETSPREALHSATQGLLLLVAGLLPMAYAELTLPSSVTAIVIGCAPAGFALFDRILNGTPIRRATMVALALGVSGIALLGVSGKESATSLRSLDPRGLAFVIFGCGMWCFGSVLSRRLKPVKLPVLNVFVQYAASGAVLSLIAILSGHLSFASFSHLRHETLISLCYLALGPSLISYTSYLWLLRSEPSSRVSTYAFVNPVIAVIAGSLLLGESAGPSVLCALAFVLAGTALQFGFVPRLRPLRRIVMKET